jgi:gas vesicle protein
MARGKEPHMTAWMIMKRYLKFWVPFVLYVSLLISIVGPVLSGERGIPFLRLLLLSIVLGLALGFAAAFICALLGKFVRRKIRNKEDAWKTHVEKAVRVALNYEEAFEKTRRLLRSIRAGIVYESKERHTITGRTSGERLSVRFEELAHDETQAIVRSVPKRSTLLADKSIGTRQPNGTDWMFWEDSGKNALNVQRLCDGLVAAAGTPVGNNGPACSVS